MAPMLHASFAPIDESGSWRRMAVVLASMAMSVYIDIVTGYEVSVFLLYTVPVALATRWLGNAMGAAMAVLGTVLWIWADKVSGHAYSHAWFLYINALTRLFCFFLTMVAVRYVMAQKQEIATLLRAFSGEVPVCRQCDRLGDADGYWRSFENYLVEFGRAQVHHKVCPDCARRAYARAAYRDQSDQVGSVG